MADQGPASLWWNPAAIGWDEGGSAAFGATAILPVGRLRDGGTQVDRPGTPPAPVGGGSVMRDPVQKGLLPGSAAALRISDRIALGLAIASPFSFTTDYDPSGWQRYSAIRTRLLTLDLQPSLAFAPSDRVSLGIGLNVEYADAFLSNALPNLTPGSADGRFILDGRGWDLGWSAGAQLRPAKGVTLGLSYKSAIEHDLKGPATIRGLAGPLAGRNLAGETVVTFSTPWQLIMGARAAVSPRSTVNFQAVRFGWSRFERLDIAAPINGIIPQNYKDVWSLAAGVDHSLSERFTLRAGLQRDETPTRDPSRDARVPDGDRMNYNAGASFSVSDRLTFDAAVSMTTIEDVPIARNELFYGGTAAETSVLTSGRGTGARVFIVALGGRMAF